MTAQRQPHELILRARQGDRKSFGEVASIAEHLIRNAAQKKAWTQLSLAAEIAARAESPSKQLRRDERFNRLEKALRGLKADHREVIMLARIEGLRAKDIALRMNRSEDAVHKLLARALLRLKESFGDTESLSLPHRHIAAEGNRDGE